MERCGRPGMAKVCKVGKDAQTIAARESVRVVSSHRELHGW